MKVILMTLANVIHNTKADDFILNFRSVWKRLYMIVRIWQGIVRLANAAKYQSFLEEKVLPCYRSADGNMGVYLCGEVKEELVNFLLLSLWSSHDALVRFAGMDVDAMSHSNEEKQFLLAFESMARNYEVLQLPELQKVSESVKSNDPSVLPSIRCNESRDWVAKDSFGLGARTE